MPITNYPNGVSSFGSPVLPQNGYYAKVLWVGNTSGLKSGDGSSPENPLSAIFGAGGALERAHATLGTRIMVHRGHAENVSEADAGALTGAAVNIDIVAMGPIVPLPGPDTQRPTLTWSAAGSTWLFDTVGIRLYGFNLNVAGPAGTTAITVAAPITVSKSGCGIFGCYWNSGIDADQLATIPLTLAAGADGFKFIGNTVRGNIAAASTTFLRRVDSDDIEIAYNDIRHATTVATVGVVQSLTTASTGAMIHDNFMANLKADSTIALTPMTADTGDIFRNYFRVYSTGITPVTGAGLMELYENYVVNTFADGSAEAGALVGTASS